MLLPKYRWVVELTKKDLIDYPLAKEHKIIGEILIDSTADRNDTGPQSYLALYLYGRMIIQKPPDFLSFYYEPNEKPYPQLL